MSTPLTAASPALAADTKTQRVTSETQIAEVLANPIALTLYRDIDACKNPDQLHAITRLLWERYGAGQLNDYEASYIASCIERRRPVSQLTKANKFTVLSFRSSRFISRQRPRSPNRQASRDRRRMLGGSSALPPNLRSLFTEGQRAVLCVVYDEIRDHGYCDKPNDWIAARAGVCRTTVQTAMHEGRRVGLLKITERPQPGRKNLPNLVEVVSAEWIAWIKRGPKAHVPSRIGSNLVKMVSTTESVDLRKKEASQENRCDKVPIEQSESRRHEGATAI
jgi:hypothetical protein